MSLTQHHVNLSSMVRLMVEQMSARYVSAFHIVFILIIRVCERAAPKRGIEFAEERFQVRVLPFSGSPQITKIVV